MRQPRMSRMGAAADDNAASWSAFLAIVSSLATGIRLAPAELLLRHFLGLFSFNQLCRQMLSISVKTCRRRSEPFRYVTQWFILDQRTADSNVFPMPANGTVLRHSV